MWACLEVRKITFSCITLLYWGQLLWFPRYSEHCYLIIKVFYEWFSPLTELRFYRAHFLLVHFWKKRVTQQRCWVVLKSPKNRVIRKKRGHTSSQSPYNKVTRTTESLLRHKWSGIAYKSFDFQNIYKSS